MQYRQITKDFKRRINRRNLIVKTKFSLFLGQSTGQFLITSNSTKKNNACKGRIKNICLASGLERSILPTFNVSRHWFKKNVTQAHYPGVRKASW